MIMNGMKLAIAISAVLLPVTTVHGRVDLPQWTVGSTFDATLSFNVGGDYAGGVFNMDFTASQFTMSLDEIAMQTLAHGSQNSEECNTLNFAGTITGAGTVDIWEPLVISTEVELRNGSLSGYYWVTTDSLSVMRRLMVVEGEAWAVIFQNWQNLGTVRFVLAHEIDPPGNDFDFPLDVGNQWNQAVTQYVFGDIEIDVAIFGQPYIVNQHIETSKALSFNYDVTGAETMNACMSYKIESIGDVSDVTQSIWYCPDTQWYSRYLLENLNLSSPGEVDDLHLISYSLDVLDSAPNYTPTPTVTPAPTPTATPYIILGVTLDMPSNYYHTGDQFYLNAVLGNPGPRPLYSVPLFVMLEFAGEYWFWPTWVHYPPDIAYEYKNVPLGLTVVTILEPFSWPDAGGPVTGIRFYGAMLNDEMTEIMGELAMVEFGYGP